MGCTLPSPNWEKPQRVVKTTDGPSRFLFVIFIT